VAHSVCPELQPQYLKKKKKNVSRKITEGKMTVLYYFNLLQ
jgi:hypothetical protein